MYTVWSFVIVREPVTSQEVKKFQIHEPIYSRSFVSCVFLIEVIISLLIAVSERDTKLDEYI